MTELEYKIVELKRKLRKTDYKALKYAEGYYNDEEYAPIKEEREAIREQIRELTDSLTNSKD